MTKLLTLINEWKTKTAQEEIDWRLQGFNLNSIDVTPRVFTDGRDGLEEALKIMFEYGDFGESDIEEFCSQEGISCDLDDDDEISDTLSNIADFFGTIEEEYFITALDDDRFEPGFQEDDHSFYFVRV